ncbi:unnamed protein product [Polarella glacialis]|uniref:DNA (cytosine-5-)-methyltransferase n=1 Tax=Polarella glacialis TaxID=89957 RepID=A0A813LLZ9_POLGL|nr:unnamed protein product [Polarella glacialis]
MTSVRKCSASACPTKMIHQCPIYDDVMDFSPVAVKLTAKGVGGGFPCQGISKAGKQKGLSDERTQLIRQIFIIFDESGAEFIYLENVGALLGGSMKPVMEYIIKESSKRGLSLNWATISGFNVGAKVGRQRVFLVAASEPGNLFKDLKIVSPAVLGVWSIASWNPNGAVPLHSWLSHTQTAEDKLRLKALGNIVFPRCAQRGVHCIASAIAAAHGSAV